MIRIASGVGHGYIDENNGKRVCMIRCFHCGQENWAMAVAAGYCAWCGYDPNKNLLDESLPTDVTE